MVPGADRRRLLSGVAIVAAAVALIVYSTGALDGPERQTVDARFVLRGKQRPPNDIVIVALDDASLQAFNLQLPIPRSYYARLLDAVRASRPRLIGLDLQFTGTSSRREDDEELLRAIARSGPVLLTASDSGEGPAFAPLGAPAAPGAVLASGAVDTDPDGVLRRMMYAQVTLKTFAVRGAELIRGTSVDERRLPRNHAWIDFAGPPGTFPTYSMADVLDGRVPAEAFAGKAVLVGITAPVAKDVFVTAASSKPMAGVEIHANALATVLDRFPLRPVSQWFDVLLIFVLCLAPVLAGTRLSSLAVAVGALVAALLLLAAAQAAFNAGSIVTLLAPLVGLALATAGVIGVDTFIARSQVKALEEALDGFLRPAPVAFFISYRRDQEGFVAGTLRAMLAERFGEGSVFMDRSAIKPGQEWPREIQEAILGCSAMLVLIGPRWAATTSGDGTRRLDDPGDWVRLEVEAALRRPEVAVVPVLVNGASMPSADDLPEPLRPLAERQAFVLRGEDPKAEIDGLVTTMQQARVSTVSPSAGTGVAAEVA